MNQSRRKGDKRDSKETACYFFLPSELHKSATLIINLIIKFTTKIQTGLKIGSCMIANA